MLMEQNVNNYVNKGSPKTQNAIFESMSMYETCRSERVSTAVSMNKEWLNL